MRCCDTPERIDEVLESAIHTVEEISCDAEHLWRFFIYLAYDPPDEARPEYVPYVDIRYMCDRLPIPRRGKVADLHIDTSRMDDTGITDPIEHSNSRDSESYGSEKLKRKREVCALRQKSKSPYKKKSKKQVLKYPKPYCREIVYISRLTVVPLTRTDTRAKKAQ